MKRIFILSILTSQILTANILFYFTAAILPGIIANQNNGISSHANIKKTGQVLSYDENGTVVPYGTVKDDGYYQIAITPSYTRVSGIVTDEFTQLKWQDNEAVQKQWLTTANYDICANDPLDAACYDTRGDTATTYCSNLNLGPYMNWRLPTSKELEGILLYNVALNAAMTDPTFVISHANYYWTSQTHNGLDDRAWYVRFWNAQAWSHYKNNSYYVRCVSDGR